MIRKADLLIPTKPTGPLFPISFGYGLFPWMTISNLFFEIRLILFYWFTFCSRISFVQSTSSAGLHFFERETIFLLLLFFSSFHHSLFLLSPSPRLSLSPSPSLYSRVTRSWNVDNQTLRWELAYHLTNFLVPRSEIPSAE